MVLACLKNKPTCFFNGIVASKKGTQGEHGNGLGMMLVQDVISQHGGKIWVESDLGEGAEFYFNLPN